ncbi:MAG: response regulator [Desulfobulbaceae bacterium]|nr:response regulator [Desulfobulbaceae bacterium]
MTEKNEKIRTILIVDDIKENTDLLEAILSTEYLIRTASRGSEALEVARETLPDLILLDIMMPDMNGYDVCRALKANSATKRIPVIFVTALLNPGDETRGFEAGGVDYLTKPVIGAVVRVRVKAHLALKEAQDVLEEWNNNLKKRLLQSISNIRKKTEALMSAEERGSHLHGYTQSVELLSGVFELMEDRFGVSSRAVSELAGDAARQMGLSAEEVAKVRLAGLLHDVGTLGTGRGKSEKLESEMTTNELTEFHTHPLRGQDLFSALEEMQDIGQMVRSHHETFNGNGFPDGLKGDDIPLGARLVAIADIIEHAASSVSDQRDEYALMTVRRHAGTLLDPRLISYFTMITRTLFFEKKKSGTIGEIEVPPNELISGMQISRDLTNEAGVLLLQKGDRLDSASIDLIRRNSRTNNSSKDGVWLYIGTSDH